MAKKISKSVPVPVAKTSAPAPVPKDQPMSASPPGQFSSPSYGNTSYGGGAGGFDPYSTPRPQPKLRRGDPFVAQGQAIGRQSGQEIYGQSQAQTGADVADVIRRRKERLSGQNPAASSLRESRNRQIRMARASGASAAQIAQISRGADQDIERAEFQREGEALGDFQRLIGNVVGGQSSLEMAHAGLAKAGEKTERQPSMYQTGNAGWSVICTELARQGILKGEILDKDRLYGIKTRLHNPDVYYGYEFLAMPVVKLMKKSKPFTRLISIPAMAWANNMAGNKNLFGAVISFIGEPICALTWRVKNAITKGLQRCGLRWTTEEEKN